MSTINFILDTLDVIYNYDKKIDQIKIPPGLPNVGNTCFHNSVIQLFYRMLEITNFITNDKIKSQYKRSSPINSLIEVLQLMKSNNLNKSSFSNLVMRGVCPLIPLYYRGTQQDANELLTYILTGLFPDCPDHHLENNNIEICKKVNGNIIVIKKFPKNDPRNLFRFKLDYEYCETNIKGDDIDNINKKSLDEYLHSCNSFKKSKTDIENILFYIPHSNKSLNEGINNLIEPVIKRKNNLNKLFIQKKKLVEVSKYLIIALKSFEYDMYGNSKKKPHKIILDDIKINNNIYELIGIVYHIGMSINSGHYITNIRYDNTWYEFNDRFITKLDSYDKNYLEEGYSAKLPYIVLYERIDEESQLINPKDVPSNLNSYLENI